MSASFDPGLVDGQDPLKEPRAEYARRLTEFLALDAGDNALSEKIRALYAAHETGVRFFHEVETLVGSGIVVDGHGSRDDDCRMVWLAETCSPVLDTISRHYDAVFSVAKKYKIGRSNFLPSRLAYANMQRAALHFQPEESRRLKGTFRQLKLPIAGFKSGGRMLSLADKTSVRSSTVIVAALGALFLLIMLAIALFVPAPTQWQEYSFRLVLSLTAGAIGGVLPGFVTFSATVPIGRIRAGGAIALFLIVYLVNPATFVSRGTSGDSIPAARHALSTQSLRDTECPTQFPFLVS